MIRTAQGSRLPPEFPIFKDSKMAEDCIDLHRETSRSVLNLRVMASFVASLVYLLAMQYAIS